MMPALDWLKANAGSLGDPTAGFFYWSSGALSSVLDNAPTYLSFLNAIFGAFVNPDVVSQVQHLSKPAAPTWPPSPGPTRTTSETLLPRCTNITPRTWPIKP